MLQRLLGRTAAASSNTPVSSSSEMGSHPKQLPDWANLEVIHRNTLPPRAYFHLFNSEKDAGSRDVDRARALSLSGTWKFNLSDSPFDAPTGFETASFNSSKWGDITVPGMWQMQGYGRGPQYTNVQYPFHVDPPHPPYNNNECGSYITRFKVPEQLQDDQLRLRFEGVDSSFHVWLNGREVGYSQGSRNSSEFDVTDFAHKSEENVLAVRVYQFCDGSYIEDQDQWWLSGIFRDVWLLGFPKAVHIEDIYVRTILDTEYKDAELKVDIQTSTGTEVKVMLQNSAGDEVAGANLTSSGSGSQTHPFSINVRNPHKWTAETPCLYRLIISTGTGSASQYVLQRVGFRQVEVKDGLIKINGRRVVFKGANRHEHHPKSGRTVPLDFLKRDLTLMKTHNINAIRTCHQPSDPRLYDLADEMGFWVMDEADLECHGFDLVGRPEHWTSDNPAWHDAYLDRAKQLVHRDKNHACVVMWSLGNEAFLGRNHVAMYKWIKSYDPSRPVHYEQDYGAEHVDIYSRMYPAVSEIIRMAQDDCKRKKKPLVLCEYIHAMGTGPGNIEEYVDAFYKYPELQGGWVWEWANHGLLTKTADGTPFYGYGGDFGDEPNDYNFVMDGVLRSDHTPKSGLIEYKKALEPVQVVESDKQRVKFINRLDFATLDHLTCQWKVVDERGAVAKQAGQLEMPLGVEHGKTFELSLPKVTTELSGEAFFELSFRLREKASWADAGYELAYAQVSLTPISPVSKPKSSTPQILKVENSGSTLIISSSVSRWTISLAKGALIAWTKFGKEMLAQPLEPSFYRALTDNDAPQDGADWKSKEIHLARIQTRNVSWQVKHGQVVVEMEQKFSPPVLAWALELKTKYVFDQNNLFTVTIKGRPAGDAPAVLPRIGVTLSLPSNFQHVEWFGRGPGESYKDMKLSQRVALHSVTSVDDLWTAQEFPQECSNRTDTRWLRVSSRDATLHAQFFDPQGPGSRKLFDFMACHYDVRDIEKAQHPYELERKKKELVILRLDAEHHGLGTGSCGPKTLEEYALKTGPFEFGLLLQ